MDTPVATIVIVFLCLAVYVACVTWASGKIVDLSDAPPEMPPPVRPYTPLTPVRLPAITELPQIPMRIYKVWLFDGVKFHEYTGAGRRPFRITALGHSWDQNGTHLDGLPIYIRSDAPPRRQRSKGAN